MNKFDERYSSEDYYYGTEPNAYLAQMYQRIPAGGAVLCLAEGEGRNAVFLAQQGYRVTAMDSSSVGLNKLKRLAASRNVSVQTIHADLQDFQMGEAQWDGVVSIFCHLPPSLLHEVNARIVAALRPGGVFILEAYRPEQVGKNTGGPKETSLCVSLATLEHDFASLQIADARSIERSVIEGKGHTGVGAVVQFTAIKK